MSSNTSTTPTTSPAPCQREYVTYIVLSGSILMFVLKLISLATMGRLLVCACYFPKQLKSSHLSLSMYIYLVYHSLGAFISIPYQLYKIIWWRLPAQIPAGTGMYNPYILFWTGIFDMSYKDAGAVPVFFLTIDRICALNHGGFMGRHKKEISIVGAIAVPGLYLYCLSFWIIEELPLAQSVLLCQMSPSLMVHQHSLPQLYGKMLFGTSNFIACLVFLIMLKKFVAGSNIQSSLKNRTVKFAMFCELILDMIPAYFGVCFTLLAGMSAAFLIGEYAQLLMSTEAAICGVYYWAIFRQPRKTNSQAPSDRRVHIVRQSAPTITFSQSQSSKMITAKSDNALRQNAQRN